MPSDLSSHLSPTSSADSPVAGFVSFLKILRKHWPIIVACVALAGGAALLYSKSVRRIYQASSLIEMNPRAPQPLGEGGPATFDMSVLFMDPQEFYQTQYNIITSRAVLEAAAEAISLGSTTNSWGCRSRRRYQSPRPRRQVRWAPM